ncbi:MAG: hypothetical protein YHS30scaffold324_3 [Catenulispora phage 69_17]|nr:MAG: hypothetical protein YHS30scaffold324_3 [Catenulispora phage 69_17]
MTLEEIKTAIVEKIDMGWQALKDEIDPDVVRTYVQKLTTELYTHVLEVEAHLVNHVLAVANHAPPPPAPDQSAEPPALAPPVDGAEDTSWAAATAPADVAEPGE